MDLRELAETAQWQVFRKACDNLYDLTGRRVLGGGLDEKQYAFHTGFLSAIETLATLPDNLTTVMTRVQDDERRKRSGPDTTQLRTFYGSPYYDPSLAGAGLGSEGVGAGEDG